MIPLGNTVSFKIYMTWAYEEICPFLLATFYLIELFKFILELFCLKKYFIRKVSTTLFNIEINNIVKQGDPGVECSRYVDDFVIMYKSPTINVIQKKLQHTINRLEKWTLINIFTISENKTIAMHFCPDEKCMDPVLKLDNDHIQFFKKAKFLGLIWGTKLTFKPHIKYFKAHCQKSLNILKVLSCTKWGADQTTL